MQLIKIFSSDQYSQGLESWGWLDIEGKKPMFTSLFGDVFFDSIAGCWFLDTIEGSLKRCWRDRSELQAQLATPEGQDQFLMGALAIAAQRKGLVLGPDQVYEFNPPPVLGGNFDIENVVALDFVVALNIAGQLHGQIKDLPPGTPISGIRIDGVAPPDASSSVKKRWFRRRQRSDTDGNK